MRSNSVIENGVTVHSLLIACAIKHYLEEIKKPERSESLPILEFIEYFTQYTELFESIDPNSFPIGFDFKLLQLTTKIMLNNFVLDSMLAEFQQGRLNLEILILTMSDTRELMDSYENFSSTNKEIFRQIIGKSIAVISNSINYIVAEENSVAFESVTQTLFFVNQFLKKHPINGHSHHNVMGLCGMIAANLYYCQGGNKMIKTDQLLSVVGETLKAMEENGIEYYQNNDFYRNLKTLYLLQPPRYGDEAMVEKITDEMAKNILLINLKKSVEGVI